MGKIRDEKIQTGEYMQYRGNLVQLDILLEQIRKLRLKIKEYERR